MKVLIFSHESDLDGLYSAAIGLIRYPQAKTIFLGYGKENFEKIGNFTHLIPPEKERGLIIIADLGLNDDMLGLCASILDNAIHNGWQVMWVDHHPWSQEAIDLVRKCGELVHNPTGQKCAADLMYERLLPKNQLAANLASMAHTMDFFTKNQYLTPVTEIIRYYQTLPDFYERMFDLARKSAKGILWDVEMQDDYAKYEKLRDEARALVLAATEVRESAGIKVAYIPTSQYLQSSLFSEEVFAVTGADLALFYSSKGKVSIRRNNNKISCRAVAANLPEGGGHEYAAGATFASNPENKDDVISELAAAVSKAIGQIL